MHRSHALALAVALAPVFLQQQVSCERGDTYLLGLRFDVDGQDLIEDFNINDRNYAISTSDSTATLSVETRDATSTATYEWIVDGATVEAQLLGPGGGTATISIPPGQSRLHIGVRAFEGGLGSYVIDVDRTAITVEAPLEDERFVAGETISFRAVVSGGPPPDGSELSWSSSLDGPLGTGADLELVGLSLGTHEIQVAGYGTSTTTQVRVFADLEALYHSEPATGEIERIRNDFVINTISGTGFDEDWEPYLGSPFDQSSTDPTELALVAKLDVLRRQRFSEPLPFTGGATIYEHLRTHVDSFELYLECRYAAASQGRVYFGRRMSVWDRRSTHTDAEPDLCKEPLPDTPIAQYIGSLSLAVHEGRHCEPDDPGHTLCGNLRGDATLEGGSGYAQAALYAMWVYKYGLYDPPAIKERAKLSATTTLRYSICSTPTHSNPLVQDLIDELLN